MTAMLLGTLLVAAFLVVYGQTTGGPTKQTAHYDLWQYPVGFTDVTTTTTPGAVMIGGGDDPDGAFGWQIEHANGGDIVVLMASGSDYYYTYYMYNLSVSINHKVNSVTTIYFKDRDASFEPEVLQLISNAEAIFFAGGDQSLYLKYWTGTEVQSIIQSKLDKITVGGTSAGLAILGNWIYSAAIGTSYSDECMLDPYSQYVQLADAFVRIPYLNYVLTDTHVDARDRMGRMLTFMGRIMTDEKVSKIYSVGVDESTALLVDHRGMATMTGTGHAYVCTSFGVPPQVCKPDAPLTYQNVTCTRLSSKNGDSINFDTLEIKGGVTFTNSIVKGRYDRGDTCPYGPGPF